MAEADTETKDLILKLASDPASVRVDEHAKGNMMAWDLTREDVCQAICDWINRGERVKEVTIRTHPKALVGQPAYSINPVIDNKRRYVRLTILRLPPDQKLLILQAKLDV